MSDSPGASSSSSSSDSSSSVSQPGTPQGLNLVEPGNLPKGSIGKKATPQAPPEATAPKEFSESDFDTLVSLKINGKTEKMPLREVMKLQQLEKASKQKMNEVHQIEKKAQQTEALLQLALENPKDFYQRFGKNAYDWAENLLIEKIELSKMSEGERKAVEYEKELKRYKDEEKTRLEHEKVQESERQIQQAETELHQNFVKAWEQSGLPPDKYFGQLMAAELLNAHAQGKELSESDAADKVKKRFISQAQGIFGQMDANAILEILGDATAKKLRMAEVKKVTDTKAPPTASSGLGNSDRPRAKNSQERPTFKKDRDFREWLESHKS